MGPYDLWIGTSNPMEWLGSRVVWDKVERARAFKSIMKIFPSRTSRNIRGPIKRLKKISPQKIIYLKAKKPSSIALLEAFMYFFLYLKDKGLQGLIGLHLKTSTRSIKHSNTHPILHLFTGQVKKGAYSQGNVGTQLLRTQFPTTLLARPYTGM